MRLRHQRRRDVRTGDADATQALPGAGHEQERAGAPARASAATRFTDGFATAISIGISTTTPVRYGPRRPVPTKLDAYKAIIETRLAAYPELSAVRLLAEIRAAGLCRQLHAAESVRPSGAPDAAAGAGHPLRDAGGPPSAGRLRAILVSVGRALRACSSCSATRGCCGAGFIRARTCGR